MDIDRRGFIQVASVGVASLSGCVSGSSVVGNMEGALETETATEVMVAKRTDEGLIFEMSTQEPFDMIIHALNGVYAGAVRSYDTTAPLRAEVYVVLDDQNYLVRIPAEWARQYNSEEITAQRYYDLVTSEIVPIA